MAVSLLKMTADKATVAEGVTTYDRAEVEKSYAIMKEQMDKDLQRLPQLEEEIREIRRRIDANSYTLDLFEALVNAFNRDFPKDGSKPAPEPKEVQKPVVQMDAEKVSEPKAAEEPEEALNPLMTEEEVPDGTPVLDEEKPKK